MSAKSNSGSKDALELNRLAGGLTTASGLYFVALARVPYSFTSSADPLVYEPEVAIPVAAFASWVFSLYTSSRLRAWWRQDLNDATVNQEEAPEDKSPELSMVDVDRSERSYWVRSFHPSRSMVRKPN